jgi:hypothetical protein
MKDENSCVRKTTRQIPMRGATVTFANDCDIQVSSPNCQGAITRRFLRGDSVTGIVRIRMIQTHLGPVEGCDIECEDGRVLLDVGIQCLSITDARTDSARFDSLADSDDTMTGIDAVSTREIDDIDQANYFEAVSIEKHDTPGPACQAREHKARLHAWLSSVFRIDRRCVCGRPCTSVYCQDCEATYPTGTEPKVRYRKSLSVDDLDIWQVND